MPSTEQQLYWYMCLVLKDRLEDINMLESIIKISTLHPDRKACSVFIP